MRATRRPWRRTDWTTRPTSPRLCERPVRGELSPLAVKRLADTDRKDKR